MAEDQGQAQTGGPETEKIKSITAGLFESDYDTLQNVAGELAVSRSMVVRSAVQNFFRRHRAGEIGLAAEEGDLVILFSARQSYTYVVEDVLIVEPTQVEYLESSGEAITTLISCYPYLVDNKRIVVIAHLIED